ncbi:dynein regulatory complex protein 10 isoform X1 [Phymastichus coffea]|uniref:dynein regulatory complex protein 10 isoform X1 n=1 Tax=Phymastichus coffea TaxID=108790 RepID=UPI00273BF193|nr:dynein regulatory complex protein 10 isoform X1 [Phymastichus coffea]XP_058807860.1 dynein regulatory complex protein 10 isoform X1 [Phymastichus coffea]
MGKSTLEQNNHFVLPEVANSEVAVFAKRLVGIFEILMTKLELAATLPLISSDASILKIVKDEDSKRLLSTFFSQFTSDHDNSASIHTEDILKTVGVNFDNSGSLKQIGHSQVNQSRQSSCSYASIKDRIDVYQLLQIVLSNPTLFQLSKSLQSNVRESNYFLRQIKYFMEFVVSKVLSMPVDERDTELNFRNVCAQIEQSKLEMLGKSTIASAAACPTTITPHLFIDLTTALQDQKSRQRAETQQLTNKLDNLLNQWQNIDEEYNVTVKQLLNTSKDKRDTSLEEFTERINSHRSLFERLKTQLANDKANNKKIEHDIQMQKFKVESQLTSLIMKFDTEIGDRQETYDELMKEYVDLEQEKSQLTDAMNEQFIIYNSIITEREEKAFEEYREKYMKFVNNRSARLIQRWWRAVRSKLKKKDKKKGKKKKTKA